MTGDDADNDDKLDEEDDIDDHDVDVIISSGSSKIRNNAKLVLIL